MFMIEIAGVRVLYTGDFSREEDRHLMAAELPSSSVRPGDSVFTKAKLSTNLQSGNLIVVETQFHESSF
jgi:cleavage and polyadenylation specificity factor subunit 3